MERYQVVGHLRLDPEGTVTSYADAQAQIETLQAQVKELEGNRVPHSMQHVIELQAMNNRLEQQVEALQARLEQEREKVKGLHEVTRVICTHCCEPMEIPSKAVLQTQLTQLRALMRALPDCPGEIKVYPPAVGVICGTYDVRYDFHLESGSFQSIRLAMFHDECEADTYADLLKYRATLDATTPAQTDEQRCIEACCERPHDCKWGGTGGCGYEGRKPKGGDGE